MLRKRPYQFTSESVTEGHPDKISDQISDAVLDAIIAKDTNAKVACETFVTTGLALISGEITTNTYVDIQKIVRGTVCDIGYIDAKMGFDYNTVAVLNAINEQSPDIAQGVVASQQKEQGAGDQGIMFGYACKETPEYMPYPIMLAHALTFKLAEVRKNKELEYLRPDGKSQVTIKYEEGNPVSVDAVVIAAQHEPDIDYNTLKSDIINKIIHKTLPENMINDFTRFHINETGKFERGGPYADTGLTGRKIIVDTYGGVGSHGGGCFSGKDPSKVDRSASYMMRHVAKNIIAADLASEVEVQIGYAIGIAEPVSFQVNCKGTELVSEESIEKACLKIFNFRPAQMIEYLDLLRPIYRQTAVYGHFGREIPEFTWEKINRADELRDAI